MNDASQKNGTGMTKEIRDKMRKGHTCILSLAIALGGVVSAHAGDSPGMPLLDEDFETPDVTTTSLLQDGGTYHKGSLPTGGKWVGATQGFGANRIGIINKTFGDFTAAADNHQGFYFGYTNCGITSSTSAISHTLELGAKYTLSFDVARDNNKAQSSYTVQLVAFEPEENDTVRNEVRPGSSPGVVLATLNGTVTTNDLTERVSLVFQPDESIHYRDVGKAIGIRFLGNSSNPIIDNVHLIVDLDGALGQGIIPDSDGDGLPDAWEIATFGNLDRDGTSDLDRDGLTDAFEFTANLDPNDYDTQNGIPDWVGYLDTVNGETLLSEDFENPGVIGTSVLQFGATFDKGKLPASGKWVGSSLGFGADRKGLIHKNFGDFVSPDGNDQGCYFGYTNAGITSSAAAISHVLDQDAIYVLSFDVARDNDKAQASYAMELVAFSPEQGDVVRNDTRDGSRPGTVLSSASGIVLSNDMSKRVSLIFKPDATLHATHFGKSLGLRFLGNYTCPILDNVSLKVIDTKTIEPGALGYLTVEHWDNVPGHTLTDLFANQAFYQDANWIYLTPQAKSLSNVGSDYGMRMTGRVIASQSGQHQFLLGGGGECQMFLSTDERAFNRREIASFPYIPELEDDMYQGIISDPVNLVAGNEYYIEVLMKEGNDNDRDDVSVSWQFLPAPRPPGEPQVLPRPFEIIPGSSLRSYMPDAGDLDDDGMLDSWEALVGLNVQDNGGTSRNQGSYADIDGDGLLNYQEYQYNTSPLNSDTDGDGMPDDWEVQNNLNPNDSSDADLDSDGDGINNQDESRWGLNPNSADTVGPLNFGFDEVITDYPDMTFRPDHPSDLYDQSSVANWEAVIGHHIEIWDGSKAWNGNTEGTPVSETQYVELHSHLGSHGIKQTFQMLPGAKQSFILRYKGRYDSWDGVIDNTFSMKVEGAAELLVNGVSVPDSGGNRSYPFMESDTGDQWQSWSNAHISITAPESASGLQSITMSFVSKETTSDGEEITHGGFVDILPLQVEIASSDKFFAGSITIPDGMDELQFEFVNSATGENKGTYGGFLEQGNISVHDSVEDIITLLESGGSQINQDVWFLRNSANPRQIDFYTCFNTLGPVEIHLVKGQQTVAVLHHELEANQDFSNTIKYVDDWVKGVGFAVDPPIGAASPSTMNATGEAIHKLTSAALIPFFVVIDQVEGLQNIVVAFCNGYRQGIIDDGELLALIAQGAIDAGGWAVNEAMAEVTDWKNNPVKRASELMVISMKISQNWVLASLAESRPILSTFDGLRKQSLKAWQKIKETGEKIYTVNFNQILMSIGEWIDDYGNRMMEGAEKNNWSASVFPTYRFQVHGQIDDTLKATQYSLGYSIGYVSEQIVAGLGTATVAKVLTKGGIKVASLLAARRILPAVARMHSLKIWAASVAVSIEFKYAVERGLVIASKTAVSATSARSILVAIQQFLKRVEQEIASGGIALSSKKILDVAHACTYTRKIIETPGEEVLFWKKLGTFIDDMGDVSSGKSGIGWIHALDKCIIFNGNVFVKNESDKLLALFKTKTSVAGRQNLKEAMEDLASVMAQNPEAIYPRIKIPRPSELYDEFYCIKGSATEVGGGSQELILDYVKRERKLPSKSIGSDLSLEPRGHYIGTRAYPTPDATKSAYQIDTTFNNDATVRFTLKNNSLDGKTYVCYSADRSSPMFWDRLEPFTGHWPVDTVTHVPLIGNEIQMLAEGAEVAKIEVFKNGQWIIEPFN